MAPTNFLDKYHYKWTVLFVVMIGTLMAALDTSIVNVSIPAMMADLGAGLDDIEWVITGYMLAFASLMSLTGWISSRVGHRLLYAASLFLFTLGSLLCGLAWSTPSLIAARVIQAMGGGAITPVSMAMITDVFEPHERAKAMGLWGMGIIIGPAIGPTFGGWLTKTFGWPSIFLINLPIGIFGLWATISLLKEDKPSHEKHYPFDTSGFIFFTIFLVSLLLGISKGEQEGWYSPFIIWCWIIAFFSFVGFLLVESLSKHPIIDLSLFKYKDFTVCMILTISRSISLFGGVFLIPLFLQQVKGLDEMQSGLLLLPGSLIIALLMPIGGKLSEKIGPRYLAFVGIAALAFFMYLYRNININMSNWDIIYPTLIRGIGMATLMAPLMATALNSVPKNKAGMASASLSILQQIGGSLGIAVLATVLSHRTHHHLDIIGSAMDTSSPLFKESFGLLQHRAQEIGQGLGNSMIIAKATLMKYASFKAYEKGFQDAFVVATYIAASTLIPCLFLPARPHKKEEKGKEKSYEVQE